MEKDEELQTLREDIANALVFINDSAKYFIQNILAENLYQAGWRKTEGKAKKEVCGDGKK